MTRYTKPIILSILTLLGATTAYSQTVPFDSDRWDIQGSESRVEEYRGQKALYLKGGYATLKDVEFTNGIIEFDIAVTGERGFMGAFWRMQSSGNFEEFYIRPHQSGNPDANQYTPAFFGNTAWQLYYGEDYSAPVKYIFNEWMHIKIVVSGKQAEIYIRDMEKPAVIVHELKRDVKAGKIGVLNPGNFTHAHFANFRFKLLENIKLASKSKEPEIPPAGTIMSWQVSSTIDEKSLENKFLLSDTGRQNLTWTTIGCEKTGIANLARIQGIQPNKNTVFAKVTIRSDNDQIKKIQFGYSDRIKVYCNNHLIYGGSNDYQSRDYRYLGTIGYFDAVYLPLKKGENELWLAVSENFGGWGIMAKIEDMSGIAFK